MTFDEYMERFFEPYSAAQRESVESDDLYKLAKDQDPNQAVARAWALLEGNVRTPADGRRLRKKKAKMEKILKDLGI